MEIVDLFDVGCPTKIFIEAQGRQEYWLLTLSRLLSNLSVYHDRQNSSMLYSLARLLRAAGNQK
jgi:hypothetical protein